jgi:hypothetical protein
VHPIRLGLILLQSQPVQVCFDLKNYPGQQKKIQYLVQARVKHAPKPTVFNAGAHYMLLGLEFLSIHPLHDDSLTKGNNRAKKMKIRGKKLHPLQMAQA